MKPTIAAALLFVSPAVWAAQMADHAYSQDAVPQQTFDARGTWTLTAVAGTARVPRLKRKLRSRLIGTTLKIGDKDALFWNKSVMQWPSFPARPIGQQTYDTGSREFSLDFQTDARTLNLPPTITALNIQLGRLVMADPNRFFFDYEGVWFRVKWESQTSQ